MSNQKDGTAYRQLRGTAYRKKYETALNFSGTLLSFGDLLSRAEYAYNTFRQMGVEAGEKVCLWLPDCPDLLACFYGLSRLGATAVLCHPAHTPKEMENVLNTTAAKGLVTTADRYRQYCRKAGELPQGHLLLCRPEKDLKGRVKKAYLKNLTAYEGDALYLDELSARNRYSSNEPPADNSLAVEVMLLGTGCLLQCKPVCYSGEELGYSLDNFARRKEQVATVYTGVSFASEGGFLAVHSALCTGRTVLWTVEEPFAFLVKEQPDFLVGSEEFFWQLRQKTALFKGKWSNLRGGIQFGKSLTPLMEKFAQRAFEEMGGGGALTASPLPLKVREEELYFIEDFGVRLSDLEETLSRLPEVAACRCIGREEGILLQMKPAPSADALAAGRRVSAYCKEELGPYHLPEKLDFNSKNFI